MKANASMLGGSMRRQYMPSYANYFFKFLQGYEAEGVPVRADTVQNEVDTDQDGRMPACIWPQEYEADFVRYNLGPLFEREAIKTEIWLIDHNYNLWGTRRRRARNSAGSQLYQRNRAARRCRRAGLG